MTNFLIFPEINDEDGFPPPVNSAIAQSPEMQAEMDERLGVSDATNASFIADPNSATHRELTAAIGPLVADAIADDSTVTEAVTIAASGAVSAAASAISYRRGTLPASTDLNAMLSPSSHSGMWGIISANLPSYANLPVQESGALLVIVSGYGSVTQQFYPYAKNVQYQRTTRNLFGASWTAWVDVVVGTAPYDRGTLPASTDLNLMISSSSHSGQWGTSGANLGTYLNLPVLETGILEVIAPGNGAAHQRFTPYAKDITYTRSATNTTGATWTQWASSASSAVGFVDRSDPSAPLESSELTISMFGDSLTMAGGIRTRLVALMPSKTVNNFGISGQTAGQIAARQGGSPSLISVASNTIPASGPVAVTARTLQFLSQTDLPAKSMTGRLAGVAGTMSVEAGSTAYTFTRNTSGDAVTCPANSPFIADQGKDTRRDVQIIWGGVNNPETGVVDYVMAMCRHLSPSLKKFLVLSPTGSSGNGIGTTRYKLYTAANEQLAYELGDRFFDLRRWLIDNGLAAAGITPTTEDTTAIANDTIPPSLTTDGTHFTAGVQTIIGDQVHAKIVSLGWA